ncbi:Peptidoglycan binding domain containing protein [uncultured Caudovirales phage]|uniref:Peptidoglycan binding domain containing protein n=1 Tax=uncultured Caudovirales phage TaxID=2100421 RepID=A0A6J5LF29_9CAUD|nr:Peptidoglycan binding domain containing protein [uncultured Caudovirales phage]
MNNNWDKAFELVIAHEGGFTNDQRDPGNHLPDGREGCTMWGCTQANWEKYIGRQVTQEDMKALSKEDVKPLYKRDYWDAVKGDELPAGVDYAAFDFAINAGPSRSRKMIQTALGVTADGAIGPATIAAIKAADGEELLQKFSDAKEAFYRSLPTFATYGKGWLKRVADVQSVAVTMVA